MNNSLPRLIDGMVETLRQDVIPHVDGEFARGQAFGVIFMLRSIALRASWSAEFIGERAARLRELADRLQRVELPAGAPRPPDAPDQGDAYVCELVDWLAQVPAGDAAREAWAAVDAYIHRQLKHEIATSTRPMFAEISLGAEES